MKCVRCGMTPEEYRENGCCQVMCGHALLAPNVEQAGMPMGDPHPCDMTREERKRFFGDGDTHG